MRPSLLKIETKKEKSFSIRYDVISAFKGVWHYHPEVELHYVVKGEGVRVIADNIRNFSAGELIFLGENLPHCWRSSEEYRVKGDSLDVEAIVLQFLPDCLGRYLINLPEAYLLPKLFEKARAGMLINGTAKIRIVALMQRLLNEDGLSCIITLIEILKELSETDQYHEIAISRNALYRCTEDERRRFNNICQHTLKHFKREVSLREIASVGNLSTASFCRYFKLMTNKNYCQFITQIRISHACKLIVEDRLSTAAICFESGFYNLSNFYRHFKKHTGMTPLVYKTTYTQRRRAS
jgi:AraC-like DNA-binding protein